MVREVSVVIPVFNAKDTLERCITSIASQTKKPKEILLVDDCSEDNSVEISKSLCKIYPNARLIQNKKNLGVGAARNIGLLNAAAPIIMFCDADDWWENEKIDHQLEFMDKNDLDICATGVRYHPSNKVCDDELDTGDDIFFSGQNIKSILIHNKFVTSSLCVKRKSIYFLFSDLRNRQDMEFVCMNIKAGNRAGIMARNVVNYDCSVNGISSNKFRMIGFNFRVNYRVLKKFWPSLYCLLLCVWFRMWRRN